VKDKTIRDAGDEYYRTLTDRYPKLAATLRERFTAYPADSDGVCWVGDSKGERRPFPNWTAAAEARKAAILQELQQHAATDNTPGGLLDRWRRTRA
jgi:hypothetical protein